MQHIDIISRIDTLNTDGLVNGSYKLLSIEILGIDTYYGIDINSNIIFAVESNTPKVSPILQQTKKLKFAFNLVCAIDFNGVKMEKCLHVLTCFSKNFEDKEAFIRLTGSFIQSYKDNTNSIANLFTSLSSLFADDISINLKELRGFYAELYTIKYFYDNGINIYPYWQKKDKLKFDFSFSPEKRMDVKSTISEQRIHHFLHEQLMGDIYDIYIVSILLRPDDQGLSLVDLISQVRQIAKDNFETILYIDKFIKGAKDIDLEVIKYDESYTNRSIKFFNAKAVPKFSEDQPEGVYHTEYDSDLTSATYENFTTIKKWIESDI